MKGITLVIILILFGSCKSKIWGEYFIYSASKNLTSHELIIKQDSSFLYKNNINSSQIEGKYRIQGNTLVLNSYIQPDYENCNVHIVSHNVGKTEISVIQNFNIPLYDLETGYLLSYLLSNHYFQIPESTDSVYLMVDKERSIYCELPVDPYRNKRITVELLNNSFSNMVYERYFTNQKFKKVGRNKLQADFLNAPFNKK